MIRYWADHKPQSCNPSNSAVRRCGFEGSEWVQPYQCQSDDSAQITSSCTYTGMKIKRDKQREVLGGEA
jgi:hypothetical protein